MALPSPQDTRLLRVLLVDDHTILRQGIVALLNREEDIDIVGEAGDGVAGVDLARRLKPDVVVMDISLPGMGGLEATRQILEDLPDCRILALTARFDLASVEQLFDAGVAGYLLKDCAHEELVRGIHTVAEGRRYVSEKLENDLLSHHLCRPNSTRDLTARERQVLQMIANGSSIKEVALELHVSTKTVETHRRSVMEKLQIFNIAQLTKHAIRQGISSLD